MKSDRTAFMALSSPTGELYPEPLIAHRGKGGQGASPVPSLDHSDAFRYSAPDGKDYWIARRSSEDGVRKHIADASLTLIDDESWEKARKEFHKATFATGGLSLISLIIRHGVPCISPKLGEFVLSKHHLSSTLADFALTRDLSDLSAMVMIHLADKKARVDFPNWLEQRRLTKIWYGFKDVDGAMSAKLLFPAATLIEI